MKKMVRIVCFLGLLISALCISAAAAEGSMGIYDLKAEANVTVTPKTAADATITPTSVTINDAQVSGFYADAEKLTVTYSGASSGNFYLVAALSDASGIPTVDNIAYIDQSTATGTSVTFTVFPNALTSGKTYCIYLSSNDGHMNALTKIAEFKYYAPYTPGDVNEDTIVDVRDVQCVLDHIAQKQLLSENGRLAANVESDGVIDVKDVQKLLDYIVQRITEF